MKPDINETHPVRKPEPWRENLLGNTIIEFGSNMLVLNHPDVKGLHVKRDPVTGKVVVKLHVYQVSDSLKRLLTEEYGGHIIRLSQASCVPQIQASLS